MGVVPRTDSKTLMAIFKTFRDWETKYALTFMGLMVGIVGIGFALYSTFQKTAPNFRFEEISRANVIDVKEEVGKLDILFNGVNLRDKHQTLALVTLKVINDGASAITKASFDDAAPVGLQVTGGEITKADLFNASNDYLAKNMRVLTPTNSNSIITFSPIIFEPRDSFWVKLLILYSDKGTFDLKPFGKIANVKQIALVNLDTKAGPPPYWKQIIGGGVLTQVLRVLAYFFAPLFAIGFYVSAKSGLAASRKRAKEIVEENDRKQHVIEFKTFMLEAKKVYNPRWEWVMNTYVNSGARILKLLQGIDENPAMLADNSYEKLRRKLLDSEAVQIRENNKFEVNPVFSVFVKEFVSFLFSKEVGPL